MNPEGHALARNSVASIRRLELAFAPHPWPFAEERRAEIDAHFERLRRAKPALWNGQILLLHRYRLESDRLSGAYLQADYASFTAWRDWGCPEAGVTNCFSMGALLTSDDAWLLGVMSPHTAAPGKIYFPAGTPDPDDISGGMVDLAGSVMREVAEETGLGAADFVADDSWTCVLDGSRIALMKVLRTHEPAEVLRHRILAHLAHERMPELADIRIVRSRQDYDAMMPSFMITFLDQCWS